MVRLKSGLLILAFLLAVGCTEETGPGAGGYDLDVHNRSGSDIEDVVVSLPGVRTQELGAYGPGGRGVQMYFASEIPANVVVAWKTEGKEYEREFPLGEWAASNVTAGRLVIAFLGGEEVEVTYEPAR